MAGCRFYERRIPAVEEIVIARVDRIEEHYVHVTLTEYNDIEGMIVMSEMSRRQQRGTTSLTQIGKVEFAVVTRADEQTGYIDLSKRRVTDAEIEECMTRYARSKKINLLLQNTLEKAGNASVTIDDLYNRTVWELARQGHDPLDVLQSMAYQFYSRDHQQELVSDKIKLHEALVATLDMSEDERRELMKLIRKHLALEPVKVNAWCELQCFKSPLGVEAIKNVFRAALADNQINGVSAVSVKLISAPVFHLQTMCMFAENGKQLLKAVLQSIKQHAVIHDCSCFKIVRPPEVYTDDVNKKLHDLMTAHKKETMEVPADDDVSDDNE